MQTKLIIFAMLSMMFGFVSCSEEGVALNQQDTSSEANFSAEQSSFENAATRVTSTGFSVGESIGIFAVAHGEELQASGNVADNKKWTLVETGGVKKWIPATDADKIYYQDVNHTLDFYAYFPYEEGATNPLAMNLTIATDQSAELSTSDFMTANNTRGIWRGTVSLQFAHRLSRLELQLTHASTAASALGQPTGASMKVPASGYLYNLQTQVATPSSEIPTTVKMQFISTSDDQASGNKYLYYLILPPQEVSVAQGKSAFRFTFDEREYPYEGSITKPLLFTAGKCAAYEMTINYLAPLPRTR